MYGNFVKNIKISKNIEENVINFPENIEKNIVKKCYVEFFGNTSKKF